MTRLFDRYDAGALVAMFREAGVGEALRLKGFEHLAVTIADGGALPHVLLRAEKAGRRHELLDACLRRVEIAPGLLGASLPCERRKPLDLLLVQWVREGDPTARFEPGRPPLPLQAHPGLGVLRRAFRVAVHIAADLGADGVANRPKFFHDAVIFYRSRLFLFFDGTEQGRFEALHRDLEGFSLRDATLAVASWCVRDGGGQILRWEPGYQIFPVSPRLTAHFHSPQYADEVAAARETHHFGIEAGVLTEARAQWTHLP